MRGSPPLEGEQDGRFRAGDRPVGLTEQLASTRKFPPLMGRRLRGRYPFGLLRTAAAAAVMARGFSLTAIASIGSAVALLVFMLVTIGHLRVRHETGAATPVLWLGILTTGLAFLAVVVTTLVQEPLDGDAGRRPCPQCRPRLGMEVAA